MSKTNLRPYHWHENNTQIHTWFERDRAQVRIEDMRGNTIIALWDEQVNEFVDDGFKSDRQTWQAALCEYATERKIRAGKR